ncbi:MAG: GNAT family N-acetyltransferase [Solirubrobacterales bacterium]
MTVAVRAATPEDAGSIAEVALRAWEEGFRGIVPAEIDAERAWNRDGVWTRLSARDRETHHAVAELDGRVMGYLVFGPSRDRDAPARVGEVWALYVHPEAWRCGLGRALVGHALAELREAGCDVVTLWTLADSPSARAFYEACGFVHDGASQRREALGNALEVRYLRSLAAGE